MRLRSLNTETILKQEAKNQEVWDLNKAQALAKVSRMIKKKAAGSRKSVAERWELAKEKEDGEEVGFSNIKKII